MFKVLKCSSPQTISDISFSPSNPHYYDDDDVDHDDDGDDDNNVQPFAAVAEKQFRTHRCSLLLGAQGVLIIIMCSDDHCLILIFCTSKGKWTGKTCTSTKRCIFSYICRNIPRANIWKYLCQNKCKLSFKKCSWSDKIFSLPTLSISICHLLFTSSLTSRWKLTASRSWPMFSFQTSSPGRKISTTLKLPGESHRCQFFPSTRELWKLSSRAQSMKSMGLSGNDGEAFFWN